MSEQPEGPLDISLDTTQTTTVVPLIADGVMARWRFTKVSRIMSKDNKPMLKWEWELVAPAPSTEGTPIEPGKMGSKFFENIALFDKNTTPPAVPEWALKRVAQRQDALLGTGDPDNKKGKPTRPPFGAEAVGQMVGKEVIAKMSVKTDGGYTNNEFATLYFPGDIAP